MLIDEFEIKVDAKDNHGNTSLHCAASPGDGEVDRMLVNEFMAEVNIKE